MYSLTRFRPTWQFGIKQGFVLLAVVLLLLTALRSFFIFYFGSSVQVDADLLKILLMGFRVDLKWSLMLLIPAWLCWALGYWFTSLRQAAKGFAGLAAVLMMVLGVVNICFFSFYHTPISSIIFGLWQDDTRAILQTIWSDWPVVQLVAGALVLCAVPLLAARFTPRAKGYREETRWPVAVVVILVLSAALGVGVRGSFGKFPLRLQDWAVTTDAFLNAAVPNGAAALYEAWKSQQMLVLKGSPEDGLKKLGFSSPQQAMSILKRQAGDVKLTATPLAQPPEVVIISLMESMGRDEFESDKPGVNDTLGALRDELRYAQVFRQGIAVEGGTFPSLEGILFDTPISPISQSRYGSKKFPFSRLWDYKEAGYETVFLTSGSVSWRQMDRNFPRQGFDVILGDQDILQKFPEAGHGTWGVGDEWMFRYATALLREKLAQGKKVFLFTLSTTNHPPHVVPDGVSVNPVDPALLPPYIVDDRSTELMRRRLETYQYSANALGRFVQSLREAGIAQKMVMAATGDHNSRMHYEARGYWHHGNGVPILFWLPEGSLKTPADLKRWVSHRDIFPTLNALVLGRAPGLTEGRNLFAPAGRIPAQSFATLDTFGLVLADSGAVSIGADGVLTCYRWQDDTMLPESVCSPENRRAGDIGRAQRALRDYEVRRVLLSNEK